MQATPIVIGIILVFLGCIIRFGCSGSTEKWVSFNIIATGCLVVVEYMAGHIQTILSAQMYIVYSVTVILAAMNIILSCVRMHQDSN